MKKRLLAFFLTVSMMIGALPAQAFAAAEPEALPLGEVDESVLTDGMFYLGSAGAEIPENAGHGYLLKVVRYGSAEREAKVRLTMMGQTASYGKDYTVSLYGGGLFEGGVENKDVAKSMLDVMTENADQVEEYNYSDAVVDGTTEEPEELSDETRSALEAETAELAEAVLDGEMAAKASVAPPSDREEAEVVVMEPEQRELSLAEAKELATGLAYDKKPMTGGDPSLVAPYLSSQAEALNEALQSAYMVLTFQPGQSEKYVEITPKDNDRGEGSRMALLSLTAEENAEVFDSYSAFTLTLVDDEKPEPATVQFSAAEYAPEDGYATVYVERTGNLTGVLQFYMDTFDGTAQKGVNYSQVHSLVQFPFGVTERHVKIPVRSTGLTEPATFTVKLSQPGGCVIGEISEATVTIDPKAVSFIAKGTPDEGEAALPEESARLMDNGTVYDLNSKACDGALDIKSWKSSSGKYSYSKWVNDHWEINVNRDTLKAETEWDSVSFYLDANETMRYDYSGLRIDWSRETGGDSLNFGETKVKDGTSSRYKELYATRTESWSQQKTDVMFKDVDVKEPYITVSKERGMWGTDPTLKIYKVEPIYRPFAVTLKGAEPIYVVVPDAFTSLKVNRYLATNTTEYKTKCDVLLENATNTGTGTLYTHAGTDITVSLKETGNRIAKIVGIRLVDKNGNTVDVPNVKTSGSSASFRLDNAFLARYGTSGDFVKYESFDNSRGITGAFTIQPVLENETVTLTIMKDAKATFTPTDGVTSLKKVSENGTSVTYRANKGDYIRFDVNMNPAYADSFYCLGLRDPKQSIIYDTLSYDLKSMMFRADQDATLTPIFNEGSDNAIVVRVKTNDLNQFDTTRGIFTKPSTSDNVYTYFTIAEPGKVIPYRYYELEAYPQKAKRLVYWGVAYNTKVSYWQNVFPFESRANRSENLVTLSIAGEFTSSMTATASATVLLNDGGDSAGFAPLEGATLSVNRTAVGVSDANGKVTTLPYQTRYSTWKDFYVRYTIAYNGVAKYVDVDQSATNISLGSVVFQPQDLNSPYVASVTSENENGVYSSKIDIADDNIVVWKANVNYRGYDPEQGVPYKDSDGTQRYEKVKTVQFVVVDPVTHEEKSTYDAQPTDDPTVWFTTKSLVRGARNEYSSSDLLYVRVITDRVQGNGSAEDAILDGSNSIIGYKTIYPEAMQQTAYPLTKTNLYFAEANPEEPLEREIPIPNLKNLELPIIGSLMMNMNIKGFNLAIEELPNNIMRLSFGYVIKDINNLSPDGNKPTDTGVYDDSSWANMTSRINTEGEKNKLGAMSLGLKVFSLTPFAGIYIDFAQTYESAGPQSSNIEYKFIGAGIYLGLSGYFRYTYYIVIYGIPFYVGGDVTATIVGQLGFQGNTNMTYQDVMKQKNPLDDVDLDASIRVYLLANAYAGVGICGTLGVRGGFNVTLKFIYAPTVTRTYPKFHPVGFRADGAIKFWADLVLFSVPIPVYGGELYKTGYFDDLETLKTKGAASLMGAGLQTTAAGEPTLKPRSGVPSSFVANAPKLMSTFSPVASKDLITGSYDTPDPQIISLYNDVYSPDEDTQLLVYLDDDPSRESEDRTALMWTLYDGSSWSEPRKVQDDGTADFFPSLCDAGDKVVVTWASRNKRGMEDHADFASSMEIYAAFFDKQTHTFGEITRLTDDNCYDYAPVAVYDEFGRELNDSGVLGTAPDYVGGDLMIYYMKAEVDAQSDDVLTNTMNPALNNAEVMYRIYDGASGTWVTDRLSENETMVESGAYAAGQRFVSSPVSIAVTSADSEKGGVSEKTYNSPVIVDFTAKTAYDLPMDDAFFTAVLGMGFMANGSADSDAENRYVALMTQKARPTAFYAFTVDADNDMSTEWDRELYIQTYDIADRKTGEPIRLTDNDVCDSNPQLVYGSSSDVYLFWLENGSTVRVINLTGKLLDNNWRACAGSDQTLLAQMMTALEGATGKTLSTDDYDTAPDWTPALVAVGGDLEANPISSFTAFADADQNLYVAYPRTSEDGQGTDICVTGYVPPEDPDEAFDEIGSWSDPVLMTTSGDGEINELPVIASLSGDQLLMVNNRYKVDLTQDDYNTSDTRIVETIYTTVSSLAVTDVQVDSAPVQDGDPFTVSVALRNVGVKPSKGLTYSGRLLLNGTAVDTISETTDTRYLYPTRVYTIEKTFALPEGCADLSRLTLELTVQEGGASDSETKTVRLFTGKPAYEITDIETHQTAEGYELTGFITNVGSAPAENGDEIRLEFRDLYGMGVEEELFATLPVGELGIDETKPFTASYRVSPEKMDVGIINGVATVYSADGEKRSDGDNYVMALEFPYEVSVNGHAATITVEAGKSVQLTGAYEGGIRYNGGQVVYASADPSVAVVDESGVLMGMSEGETTLALSVQPYGGTGSVTVKVTPAGATPSSGSGSGSSSSSSSGPNNVAVPVSSEAGSVSVSTRVSGNTAAITAPTQEQMEKIVGQSREAGAVTMDLSRLPESVTAVSIPAKTVKAFSEAMADGAKGLTVKLPGSTVTFDSKALASIAEQATGTDFKLTVNPIAESKLNAKQREALADLDVRALYDVYLTSGSKRITDCGGKIVVQVNHKLHSGGQPDGIEVWYVADEGGRTQIPAAATADSVTFTVTQFSNYVLSYDKTLSGACDKGGECPLTAFTDLDKGLWYHDGVHWALEQGVMNGMGGSKFDPDGTTSRAMIVTMLYRMEGEPKSGYATPFRDVSEGTWYAEAVRWAAENEIVNGYSADAFGPNDGVKREQIVTILQRYAKYKGIDTGGGEVKPLEGFTDARDVPDWAVKAFRWAVDAGIINGTGNRELSPKTEASRAQVATMLMRYQTIEG